MALLIDGGDKNRTNTGVNNKYAPNSNRTILKALPSWRSSEICNTYPALYISTLDSLPICVIVIRFMNTHDCYYLLDNIFSINISKILANFLSIFVLKKNMNAPLTYKGSNIDKQ